MESPTHQPKSRSSVLALGIILSLGGLFFILAGHNALGSRATSLSGATGMGVGYTALPLGIIFMSVFCCQTEDKSELHHQRSDNNHARITAAENRLAQARADAENRIAKARLNSALVIFEADVNLAASYMQQSKNPQLDESRLLMLKSLLLGDREPSAVATSLLKTFSQIGDNVPEKVQNQLVIFLAALYPSLGQENEAFTINDPSLEPIRLKWRQRLATLNHLPE